MGASHISPHHSKGNKARVSAPFDLLNVSKLCSEKSSVLVRNLVCLLGGILHWGPEIRGLFVRNKSSCKERGGGF